MKKYIDWKENLLFLKPVAPMTVRIMEQNQDTFLWSTPEKDFKQNLLYCAWT